MFIQYYGYPVRTQSGMSVHVTFLNKRKPQSEQSDHKAPLGEVRHVWTNITRLVVQNVMSWTKPASLQRPAVPQRIDYPLAGRKPWNLQSAARLVECGLWQCKPALPAGHDYDLPLLDSRTNH